MTKLSLEESVIRAMDGTDAETIIGMITRHFRNTGKLAVLDLGCGKVAANNDPLMDSLIVRCKELAIKHPTKNELFLNYIKQQQEESRILEEEVVCAAMLIKRKT